jgi:ABC-type multidrug transport system ATPase subunit
MWGHPLQCPLPSLPLLHKKPERMIANNIKSTLRQPTTHYYETMIEDPIKQIIQAHEPPLEPEIGEYVEGFLEDVDVDDEETIFATLVEFLGEQDSQAILNIVLSRPEASDNDEPIKELPSTTMVSPELSIIQEERTTSPERIPPHDEKQSEVSPKSKTSKFAKRKERRLQKRNKKEEAQTENSSSTEILDDHASAWNECKEDGKLWGGRGHGGRGLRITGENLQNIHLPSVSLQFAGNDLLTDSPMDVTRGHRYGLLGRNGVGKSTLLRQLAAGGIPGIPHSMRILLVHQQIQGRTDQTTLEALVSADSDRLTLLEEQEQVEANLEAGVDLGKSAERLGDIVAELDAIDADGAEDRALKILKGLSFCKDMIKGPTSSLSGGWRMRLALARALFVPHSDLILLDECTNHLDLHGMNWLMNYVNAHEEHTLVVVSHDRAFLDAICTDMIVMEHQRLNYHIGNYSEYQRQMAEKTAREAQILDASEKQRSKAMTFIQKQQNNKKSTDPNKQRQAKMIKDKKLDRIGNYREYVVHSGLRFLSTLLYISHLCLS